MSLPNQIPRQRDFSAGELVEHAKRRDDSPIMRSGARQMRNWRLLNSGAIEARPGRAPLFSEPGRTDEVRVNSTTIYRLSFGNGTLRIRDANGAFVAGRGGFPWTVATVTLITWALVNFDVVICYPGMKPKVARWDGVSAWSFQDYTPRTGSDGIARLPFFRIAAKGITMTPGGTTGTVPIQFSAPVLTAAHIGAVFQWANKRLQVTAVADAQNCTATCLETLLPCQRLTVPAGSEAGFAIGDVAVGSVTNAQGEVVAVDATNHYVYVQLLNLATGFTTSDIAVGPSGRAQPSAVATDTPRATATWAEQAISDARGWPQSCAVDSNRLIFCDLPGVPDGIIWSAILVPDDLQIGTLGSSAMMEIMSGKPRIYHVVGGQDEFVFTNKGVAYIPISASNPLKPGSVQFVSISPDPASQVRPVATAEGMVYLNEGKTRVVAVLPTGQQTRPYQTREMSQFHSHLIKAPITMATTTGDGDFPERYLYILNADGTMTVGRYDAGKDWVGFAPWDGAGAVAWVSALSSRAIITTNYGRSTSLSADATLPDDATGITADSGVNGLGSLTPLVESVSTTAWVDAAVPLNAIPAALSAGAGADYPIFANAGTDLGTLTAGGGLAAAHDGVTSKAAAACAGIAATAGWFGKSLPVPQPLSSVAIYPSSDLGFAAAEVGAIRIELRASNSAPAADGSGGTLLGAVLVGDGVTPATIMSADKATFWSFWWVVISNPVATNLYLAQATATRPDIALSGLTGPLWFFAGQNVDVLDGYRYLGKRQVDATGALVKEQGEDLSAASVVAGLKFTSTLETFMPHAEGGQSRGQTTRRRGIKRAVLTVQRSIGGFTVGARRVAPWRPDDDQGQAPPLREETLSFKPLGRTYDPRLPLVKDIPGPLRVLEFSSELNI